jgi:tRNA pseudouridine55 synthase
MPLRRMQVHALNVITYNGQVATLDLHVGSGTYVRAIADALGGHCRSLRRTEVGPFRVEDADPERILPPVEALPFLPAVAVTEEEAQRLRTGQQRGEEGVRYIHGDELVAVGGTVLA